MTMKLKGMAAAFVAAASLFAVAAPSHAAAVITNGTVTLGVNDLGQLNVPGPASAGGTPYVGLRYNATGFESTAPGCLCEGWGVGLVSSGMSGYANEAMGTAGLTLVSFASTATTATSVTRVGSALEITHFYHPSTSSNLYQVDVSIKNISGSAIAAGDLVYRRVMEWDVEPTPFDEFVTISGVPAALGLAAGNNIRGTGDNGFASANPLSGESKTISCAADSNFTDCGPNDHGALFDFVFEALTDGATRVFTTFYGAAGNESDAIAALGSVGAGLYSLGQTRTDPVGGTPTTFIFGFGSDGGVLTPPRAVPEPGSMALLGLGFAGLAAFRRKQKRAA
ncbi:PEP-CTERM sorting domain-containing protein [Noviherbaspirillum denitrificans]|uniref:Ice-binding protein C-terminal domain-containing protein n=1 Tax=Noviherbaspirillum denitrificans TaxID=1968433 RepID=A0A254T998_9BURK|nr:PEP-CTERM sorting domain-containing protein [Noviherbaspirillum denitrificans]OWW19204.1 hypothetical protein AYR66_06515 [Noviherbaspirillum denitrificans]